MIVIEECIKVAIDNLEQVKLDLQKILTQQINSKPPSIVTDALRMGFEKSIERLQIQIDGLKEVSEDLKQ